jgi:anti-anti-sigma factor
MEIHEERIDGAVVATPQGQLDGVTGPAFAARIDAMLARPGTRLLLDFAAVPYIASAGLGALLAIRRQVSATGGGVALCNVREPVAEVLRISGIASMLAVHPTRAAGLAALSQVAP